MSFRRTADSIGRHSTPLVGGFLGNGKNGGAVHWRDLPRQECPVMLLVVGADRVLSLLLHRHRECNLHYTWLLKRLVIFKSRFGVRSVVVRTICAC